MFATIYLWLCLLEICATSKLEHETLSPVFLGSAYIITYSNTTTALSNHIFCFFLSVSCDNNFVALLTFVYKSFTFKLLRKNGMIRKFKIQFATYEKWWLKLGNHLLLRWYIPKILESLVSNVLTAIKW